MKNVFLYVRRIPGLAAAAIIAVTVSGCFSMPDMSAMMAAAQQGGAMQVPAYQMITQPAAGTLTEKQAVVFDMALAEKVLPKRASGTKSDGGLTGLALSGAGNTADLNNFKKAATSEAWLTQEKEALARKQAVLYTNFSERYTALNNAAVVHAAFDFGGVTPAPGYFTTADAGVKAKITAACTENNAEYAIAMVGQIVHDETMQSAPISAPTVLNVEVCLFDKTGAMLARGTAQSVNYATKPADGISSFRLALDDVFEDVVLMLPALGGDGDKAGTKQYVQRAAIDSGDTREAGPDETVLVVRRTDKSDGWPTTLVLDKGEDTERMIKIAVKKEVRMVIPNGEHSLGAEIEGGTKEKNFPITITASGAPITYTLSVKGTIGQGNLKDNQRFTWTKQ